MNELPPKKEQHDGVVDKSKSSKLSLVDIQLVQQQCENQSATSAEQIGGMAQAFAYTKGLAFSDQDPDVETILEFIHTIGKMIEPQKAAGLRTTPATFRSGDSGEKPENIGHALDVWVEAFVERRLSPDELFYFFEKIHPFTDGNGRVGHCTWALAQKQQTGTWPQKLPPDVFSENFEGDARSAFGNIENP